MAPAEAAQERAQGGRGLDREAQHPLRAAGPQGVRVVDAVAARERRHDQAQELVPGVGPPRCAAQVEMAVDQLAEPEVVGQGGRQEEPRVGHQAVVVEGRREPVEAVG